MTIMNQFIEKLNANQFELFYLKKII